MMVQILPNQLNRRLSTEFLFLRHVQIINENNVFFSNRRTIDSSLYLFEFQIDCVLSLVGRGLGTECYRNILIDLSHFGGD